MRRFALMTLAGTALAGPALAQHGGYTCTFDEPAGSKWSIDRQAVSPSGERFLGTFGGEPVTLTLDSLPEHTHVVIALDLYVIGPWGGVGPLDAEGNPTALAHEWSMTLDNGTTVLRSAFSNDDAIGGRPQSYPDAIEVRNPARRGAFRVNTLGYVDPHSLAPRDTTYRLYFTVKHSGPVAKFTFQSHGLGADPAQQWGVDNVAIETYDMAPLAIGAMEASDPLAAPMGGDGGGTDLAGPVSRNLPPPGGGGTPPSGGGPKGGPPPGGIPPGDQPPRLIPTPGAAFLVGLGGLTMLVRRRRAALAQAPRSQSPECSQART
ncbi:MAG: hypothetical protein JNK35_11755 [Phycisphaerae bacterium]|nr:hypothetical protein [Phycisphaerae bacterium]